MNLRQSLIKITQKWFFFPLVGVLVFVFVNGLLFAVLWWNRGRITQFDTVEKTPNEDLALITPAPTPSPLPSASPTVLPTSKPELGPTISSQATTTPTPTVSPSPSPEPSPSASPYEKEDVRILSPNHEQNYEQTSIDIEMEVLANSEVEKLEIIVNDEVKHTFTQKPYKKTLDLGKGSFKLRGKAYLKDSETISSGTLSFGLGGAEWDETNTTDP